MKLAKTIATGVLLACQQPALLAVTALNVKSAELYGKAGWVS